MVPRTRRNWDLNKGSSHPIRDCSAISLAMSTSSPMLTLSSTHFFVTGLYFSSGSPPSSWPRSNTQFHNLVISPNARSPYSPNSASMSMSASDPDERVFATAALIRSYVFVTRTPNVRVSPMVISFKRKDRVPNE